MARPSIFGSTTNLKLGSSMPSRAVVAHALDPGAQLLLGAHVAEREHRLEVADLLQTTHGFATDSLGGRVGGEELGVISLDPAQLVEQAIIGVVADLRVIENVVLVRVVLQLLAQLLGARGGVGCAHVCASCAGLSAMEGSSSAWRSKLRRASRLDRSVRSK